MQLDSTTAVIIGAATGALVTGISSFLTRLFDRRAEERKHYRELAVQAAITDWQQHIELQKIRREAMQQSVWITPLHIYIVRMVRLMEVASDTRLNPDQLTKRMNELKPITDAMMEAARPK